MKKASHPSHRHRHHHRPRPVLCVRDTLRRSRKVNMYRRAKSGLGSNQPNRPRRRSSIIPHRRRRKLRISCLRIPSQVVGQVMIRLVDQLRALRNLCLMDRLSAMRTVSDISRYCWPFGRFRSVISAQHRSQKYHELGHQIVDFTL